MTLLHELLMASADKRPEASSVRCGERHVTYGELATLVLEAASGLRALGLRRNDRVAVFLPKSVEAVAAMFATSAAGGVFVAVNPLLKPDQVAHILADCGARVVVTTRARAVALQEVLPPALCHLVLTDGAEKFTPPPGVSVTTWAELCTLTTGETFVESIDVDMAAIFYTSGSTGRPKGVVVSHRNLVTGAQSVTKYLSNTPDDRLLAVLPFSFDYGFNQLASAFLVGGSVVLLDYLLPREVIAQLARHEITGMAGVPTLWSQVVNLEWDASIGRHLRYITNSGGSLPTHVVAKLRVMLPSTRIFLMYGLTEAFRSTYLDPSCIDSRPMSIGKAIPNAEVLVMRPDGSRCAPNEEGELVHRGSLVSMGYWNDPELTAKRFRPVPGQSAELPFKEIGVWSGDIVRMDAEGYLYFVGRNDEMIKTSGYRVSPTEIEAVVLATGMASQAVAAGVAHPTLGQAIAVAVQPAADMPTSTDKLLDECRRRLPSYMLPSYVEWRDELPTNPNGKVDRASVARELRVRFAQS